MFIIRKKAPTGCRILSQAGAGQSELPPALRVTGVGGNPGSRGLTLPTVAGGRDEVAS